MSEKIYVIPPKRVRYLSEISESNRSYDQWVDDQVAVANKLHSLKQTIEMVSSSDMEDQKMLLNSLEFLLSSEHFNLNLL